MCLHIDQQPQHAPPENEGAVQCSLTNENSLDETNELLDLEISAILVGNNMITDDEALDMLFDDEIENFHENEEIVHEATRQFTESRGIEFLYEITNMHCAAHTLQLAIKDALQLLHENHRNVIDLCRRVARVLRTKSVFNIIKQNGIQFNIPCLDVETRWCSTYLMVISILLLIMILVSLLILNFLIDEPNTCLRQRFSTPNADEEYGYCGTAKTKMEGFGRDSIFAEDTVRRHNRNATTKNYTN